MVQLEALLSSYSGNRIFTYQREDRLPRVRCLAIHPSGKKVRERRISRGPLLVQFITLIVSSYKILKSSLIELKNQ